MPSAYLLQPPGGAFPNGVMEIKPVFMLCVLFNYFILPSFVYKTCSKEKSEYENEGDGVDEEHTRPQGGGLGY